MDIDKISLNGTEYDLPPSYLPTDIYLMWGGIKISENTDLNGILNVGNYYCPTNVATATLKNCPTVHAFKMKIELGQGDNYPSQIITVYITGEKFYRVYLPGDGWKDWIHYTTSREVDGFVSCRLYVDASGDPNIYTPELNALYNSFDNNISFEILLQVGSIHRISGMKANNNHGYMFRMGYNRSGIPDVYSRCLYDGQWTDWIKLQLVTTN